MRQRLRLPDIVCLMCQRPLESAEFEAVSGAGAQAAISYDTCLRCCSSCGIGYSNAKHNDAEKLTRFYREPFPTSFPGWIHEGVQAVLQHALNVNQRESKRLRFNSSRSEDHVTWTLFRYWQEHGELRRVLAQLGAAPAQQASAEPAVLFWGVEFPIRDDERRRREVEAVLRRYGESPEYFTEPELILDFSEHGIIVIEVKLGADNDQQVDHPRWARYAQKPAFADPEAAQRSSLYQLTRNWRMAWDLAGARPMALINLGPARLFTGASGTALSNFRGALNCDQLHQFITATWTQCLADRAEYPEWLYQYISERIC